MAPKGKKSGESARRERFVRLATARTNKTIDALRLLGNCSNRSNYEYSQNDVIKIFKVVEDELKRVKGLFNEKRNDKFKL